MESKFDILNKVKKDEAINFFKQGMSLVKISKNLKFDRETVTRWIKQEGLEIKLSNKHNVNSNIFECIDSEEKAYWLGFIFADGYVSDNNRFEVSLKLSDKKHLIKLKEFLEFSGNLYEDSYRIRLCLSDKKLVCDLIKLGCIPRKSLILKYPNIPKELQHHFIRGYFDGDGSINNSDKWSLGLSIIGTNDFLKNILDKVDIKATRKVKNSKGSQFTFYFQLSGDNARKFLKIIYANSSIYLERKKERYDKHSIKRISKITSRKRS